MLKSLYIKNYAIIDEVRLNFESGYNVITGETGAGKSILLGALKLIDGVRADTKVLYDQDAKCIVEATFDLPTSLIKRIAEKIDADFDDTEVVIRREISSTGKSRAFANDTPVRLSDIKQVSKLILDIHNQHDTLTIKDPLYQLDVVDTLADNADVREAYHQRYQAYLALIAEIKKLEVSQSQSKQDLDYIKYQLEELDKIPLDGIIKSELISEQGTLSNSERIISLIQQMNQEVHESETAISDRLSAYLKQLNDLADLNPQLQEVRDLFDTAIESLREADQISSRMVDRIDMSEARLSELTDTIDHLNKLEKKHGVTSVNELIELRDSYQQQTSGVWDLDEILQKKRAALKKATTLLSKAAAQLTASRSGVSQRITDILERSLSNLSIPNAKIALHIEPLADFGPIGVDEITLAFSANKGRHPEPIADVASGGELSRVALSVKSMIADQYGVPTLIFDEIDTGISGAVAKRVGEILYHIAESRQVICITHSPQVASIAQRHFLVSKRDTDERTITSVTLLDLDQRVDEIAKMLSEDPPTGAARENAKELLGTI